MYSGIRSAAPVRLFSYRPAVDGLRGVAVLAVLGFHAFPDYVCGGFVGVDVFFVISGFLITGIIGRQLARHEFSFIDFYMRRVRRLFPALVLVLGATLCVGWIVLFPDEFERLGTHVGAAALFVANVAFLRESGYFDAATEFKPLLHLWSLGIEEQFYLVWPVVLVLFWRHRRLLLTVLCVLVLGSFVLSVRLAADAPVANFYLPFSRFWELGLGCMLALLKDGEWRAWFSEKQSSLYNLVPLLGLACIGAAIFLFDASTPMPSWSTLLPAAGALLILATPETAWFQRNVLGAPILVWTGLISYALYLWHWPLLSFANILQAGSPPIAVKWLALLSSVALAWLTYRFIEVPVRRRKNFTVHLRLIASGALAAIAGMSVSAASGFAGRFDYDVGALRPGPRMDDMCRSRFAADEQFNYCRATSAQPPQILFLGDSRAQAVYEGAVSLLGAKYSMMLLARGGCPPVLDVRIRGYDPNEAGCEKTWEMFVRFAQRVRPQVVIIVGSGSSLLRSADIQLRRDPGPRQESNEAVFEYGLRSLVAELGRSSSVIHIGEVPGFATAPSCFLRPVRLPTTQCSPVIDQSEVERAMTAYNAVLDRVHRAVPKLHLVDPVKALCEAQTCSQRLAGGAILYSDDIHLSPLGGRMLVENTELPRLIAQGMDFRHGVATRPSEVESQERALK